jgi:putative membrane protein
MGTRVIPHFTDHAANERTYLAWVRTAIAIMAFGFLLERFNLFLAFALLSAPNSHPGVHLNTRATELLGLGLILLGAWLTLLCTLRYHRNRKQIDDVDSHGYTGTGPQRALSWLVVVMGIFLAAYVARQLVALAT